MEGVVAAQGGKDVFEGSPATDWGCAGGSDGGVALQEGMRDGTSWVGELGGGECAGGDSLLEGEEEENSEKIGEVDQSGSAGKLGGTNR
jgi:hypothetical protein